MSNKRKGHLTVWAEWAKHLRKYSHRKFWKGERTFGKKMISGEIKVKK
jgi:hypothetical protein